MPQSRRFLEKYDELVHRAAVALRTVFTLTTILLSACSYGGESSAEGAPWVPGSVYGIEIGVSSVEDVLAELGEPTYRGRRFDEEADPELEMDIWLEFTNVDEERIQRVAFAADPKTHRILEAQVTPRAMSIAEAEALYGIEYVTRTMTTGPCPLSSDASRQPGVANPSTGPRFLLYPRLGLYLTVERTNNMVRTIVYLSDCD